MFQRTKYRSLDYKTFTRNKKVNKPHDPEFSKKLTSNAQATKEKIKWTLLKLETFVLQRLLL
jgi:hypothetical protein